MTTTTRPRPLLTFFAFAALVTALTAPLALAAPPASVTMTIDPVAFGSDDRPYTGRVYLVMVPEDNRPEATPLQRMHAWFDTVPLAAWDVQGITPGEPFTLTGMDLLHMDEAYRAFWGSGRWRAQAVARVSRDHSKAGRGVGDLHSDVVVIDMDNENPKVTVELTERVEKTPFTETDQLKHFRLRSNRLSLFHGRDIYLNAGVHLPASWGEPDADGTPRRYPIVYVVTGFGGDHRQIGRYAAMYGGDEGIGEAIVVVPDATNFWGHSVFANSAVTGPWGDALVHELAPALEAVYRGPADPAHRYVTGVSSGGWSSLWLQVEYPDAFGGCWSHVPDPVDFRAFQTVDIYADDANIYEDEDGGRRPIARRNGEVVIHADEFIGRETVLGPGGQIESFEGVFSPRAPDGTPVRLFDRETGAIDPATARAWEPYDLRLKIEREWAANRDRLAGKIRVYGGEIDNFYLGESVGLMRESMLAMGIRLGSMDKPTPASETAPEADVRVIEGLRHTSYRPGVAAMWRTIHERWNAAGR